MDPFLVLMFATVSQTFSLPQGLIESLCFVESSHDINALHHNDGGSNSVGICQIKVSTARSIGFRGTEKELAKPAHNIFYSAKYLSQQLDRYDGDIVKGVAAYNAGTHRVNAKGQTRNIKYINKVLREWRGRVYEN